MKLYLAHNFEARDYLNTIVKPALELVGHEITSRWIWDDTFMSHGPEYGVISAKQDLEDIESASGIVLFVDQYGDRPGRGKYLELGYALRAGKKTFLVGKDIGSSVFYDLSTMIKFNTIQEFIDYSKTYLW